MDELFTDTPYSGLSALCISWRDLRDWTLENVGPRLTFWLAERSTSACNHFLLGNLTFTPRKQGRSRKLAEFINPAVEDRCDVCIVYMLTAKNVFRVLPMCFAQL